MILVTGGTGLVGSNLLHTLLLKGEKVRGLLRPGSRAYDLVDLFEIFAPGSGSLARQIEWVNGDVLDQPLLHQAMTGIDRVYHCAAMVSFDPRDLKQMQRVNVEGTANVVNACLLHGVKKLCHVSSIAALGKSEHGEIINESTHWKTARRNSGYAVSKYGGEREVWRGIEEGLNAVIVNPSVIIGTGGASGSNLLAKIVKFLPFYTTGVNGYVDVRDVVNAMVLLMDSNITAQRFVLNSQNLTLRELNTSAALLLGRRSPYFPMHKTLAIIAAWVGESLSHIAGRKPLLTSEIVRPLFSKSYYSAEKFIRETGYEFITVEKSLRNGFTQLALLSHSRSNSPG